MKNKLVAAAEAAGFDFEKLDQPTLVGMFLNIKKWSEHRDGLKENNKISMFDYWLEQGQIHLKL
jgi:hypothetical protein